MKKILFYLLIFCLLACSRPKRMYKYSYQVPKNKILTELKEDQNPAKKTKATLQPFHFQITKESRAQQLKGNVLEISEKLFITQINDIFYNFSDYQDKKIIVEGMFTFLTNAKGDKRKPAVYRRGPGCCGNDGWGGFILKLPDNLKVPNDNDWIRVKGHLKLISEGRFRDLYLIVEELEVKAERGLEDVLQ